MPLSQDESIPLWILYHRSDYGLEMEAIFTHKVQAEAALREYKSEERDPYRWYLQEKHTVAHDNHC